MPGHVEGLDAHHMLLAKRTEELTVRGPDRGERAKFEAKAKKPR